MAGEYEAPAKAVVVGADCGIRYSTIGSFHTMCSAIGSPKFCKKIFGCDSVGIAE